MLTVLKGLFVLPLVVVVVGCIWLAGLFLFGMVSLLVSVLCIVVPIVVKTLAIVVVIVSALWGLGKLSSEICACCKQGG